MNGIDLESNQLQSFLAVFPDKAVQSEKDFERLLWQQLIELDSLSNDEWDAAVSSDPENPEFSFSIAGNAFYIVGMHPNSSRISRRSPFPTLVFNLHQQFENLRRRHVFKNIQQKIRQRDIALQGNENPMLRDFGTESEAKQYSGRKVEADWKCPFHRKT